MSTSTSTSPVTTRGKTGPSRFRASGTALITLNPMGQTKDGEIGFWWTPDITQNPMLLELTTPETLRLRPAEVARYTVMDTTITAGSRQEMELPICGPAIPTTTVPCLRFDRRHVGSPESATWATCPSECFVLKRVFYADGTYGPPVEMAFKDLHTGISGPEIFPLENSGWLGYDVDSLGFPDGKVRINGRAVTNNRIWVSFDRSCRGPHRRPISTECPNTTVEMWLDDEKGTAITPGDITMGFD